MKTRAEPFHRADAGSEWAASSPDGKLGVTLRPCAGGLYVERWHTIDASGAITQGLMFADETEFHRWCDADDARYDYPLMWVNMRRAGGDLLQRLPRIS